MIAISQNQTSNIAQQYALKSRLSLLAFSTSSSFTLAAKRGVTQWEELTDVRYNEKENKIEAIINIKSNNGYSWPLCKTCTKEYVRFFIDWNECGQFEDAGVTSLTIHNSKVNSNPDKPQQFVVRFNLNAKKHMRKCGKPLVYKVRAVLSWNMMPSQDPNDLPVYGNYIDAHIQLPQA